MFGYIYKTTNLVNNKIYIGQHRCDHFEPESYIGSGNLLLRAIDKYGKENFRNELLCECIDQNDLDEKEIYYISQYKSTDVNIGYNITTGGFGGSGPRSEETKQKITNYLTNKTMVNNGKINKRIPKDQLNEYLNNGYTQGVLPYTRSESFKNAVKSTLHKMIAVHKGDIRTRIFPDQLDEYLANGYSLHWCDKYKHEYVKQKPEGTGKAKFMHKDDDYKLVPESRQEEFLKLGYVYGGRKRKHKSL